MRMATLVQIYTGSKRRRVRRSRLARSCCRYALIDDVSKEFTFKKPAYPFTPRLIQSRNPLVIFVVPHQGRAWRVALFLGHDSLRSKSAVRLHSFVALIPTILFAATLVNLK